MLKGLEEKRVKLSTKLNLVTDAIQTEVNKLSESITKEIIFKLRDIPEVKNINGYFSKYSKSLAALDRYELNFIIDEYHYSMKIPDYQTGHSYGNLFFCGTERNEILEEIICYTAKNGKIMKSRAFPGSVKEIKKKFPFTDEHVNTLQKFLPRVKTLYAYIHTRKCDYVNYPVEQIRYNILLILAKWRESTLSVLLEKNLIIKICKHVWKLS